MLGFHEQLVFCICINSSPLLLNYISVAASMSMTTPLHHHQTSLEPHPEQENHCSGSLLQWDILPSVYWGRSGGWGGWRNLDSLADNLCHRLKFTFLCQTIPITRYSTLLHGGVQIASQMVRYQAGFSSLTPAPYDHHLIKLVSLGLVWPWFLKHRIVGLPLGQLAHLLKLHATVQLPTKQVNCMGG